jgi:phosphotransferase system enzyme I (PtsI)
MIPPPTPQAVEHRGRPAAPGVAAGPLVRLDRTVARRKASNDPRKECEDLRAAVAAAIAEICELAGKVGGDGADILEFQIAMLEDDVLIAPALDRISAGSDAVSAWTAALAAQIADYEATEDDYFRARSADLRDIGDRIVRHLAGEAEAATPEGAVLAGEDVTPSRFLSVDWSKGGGLALRAGSPSSHVAMLARSRGVPMVVALGAIDLDGHATVIVDGDAGLVVLSPGEREWAAFRTARATSEARGAREAEAAMKPAKTADGVAVSVMINVADPDELDRLDPAISDGVGLVRSEFLFHGPAGLPDEEAQYRAYRRILEWAAPKPVVIRTLDAGGDKPIDGLTIDGESNPFLGTRGIRLSLAKPEIFKVQIRAILRAAVHGNAKVMLPMVTVPDEIDAAAALFDEAMHDLIEAGAACRMPPLGIMVEVPAVAVAPALFARAAFFSIGSNDLTQYVTASARDIAAVAALNDPAHPAVMSLIANVVRVGREIGRDVSLCGDMGGDPAHLPALVAAGLRTVSVAPPLVGRAKLAIAAIGAAP